MPVNEHATASDRSDPQNPYYPFADLHEWERNALRTRVLDEVQRVIQEVAIGGDAIQILALAAVDTALRAGHRPVDDPLIQRLLRLGGVRLDG